MKCRMWFILLLIFLLLHAAGYSDILPRAERVDTYRMVFYNVENLFDTHDDSLTMDEDFTPGGAMHWSTIKYEEKLHGIFRVLSHLGAGELPTVVCLAEVENIWVIRDLIGKTPLSAGRYQIVHKDSPDLRGIDVAVLVRSDRLDLLYSDFIPVPLSRAGERSTRDIVYLCLRATSGDTLHLFVNHWPSRSEGTLLTEPFRLSAALVLKKQIDSVFRCNRGAAILVLGDFNEGPFEKSLIKGLNALPIKELKMPKFLGDESIYNLSAPFSLAGQGTYKYQGVWETIDQVLASGSLLQQKQGWFTTPAFVRIFSPEYLLEADKQFLGKKPFRTYQGPMYHGGYSDHLPVFVDLCVR